MSSVEVQRGMELAPPTREWRKAQQLIKNKGGGWKNPSEKTENRKFIPISSAVALLQAEASLQIH